MDSITADMTERGLIYMLGWTLGLICGVIIFALIEDWSVTARMLVGVLFITTSVRGAMRFK